MKENPRHTLSHEINCISKSLPEASFILIFQMASLGSVVPIKLNHLV